MEISFNPSFGDIEIIAKSRHIIGTVPSYNDNIKQRILTALQTNYGDYKLNPLYGADLDSYRGKAIDDKLAREIQHRIRETIRKEDVVPIGDVNIMYLIRGNTIIYRIIAPNMDSLTVSYLKDRGFYV